MLALVVISSIALMVGGIGVMAIMMISVTERTREIGVRKALGARRQEVLTQVLAEAAALTSVGGILGILMGAGIGVAVNLATGFPVSLPWWSFAMGLGFSASVGIIAGMVPAVRAANLDPLTALLALLFLAGYLWARYTLSKTWLVGTAFLGCGIALELAAIALGG